MSELEELFTNIFLCLENFKYLLANTLYQRLISLLQRDEEDRDPHIRSHAQQIRHKLNACHSSIETMVNRCQEIEKAFEVNLETLEGWTFGSDISGISTHYIVHEDGMISLRVEGILYDLPLYEQLCAIYEIGLYSKWVPFCSTSLLIKQISHVELVASLLMSTPFGISREVAVHAFGANCLQENQSIVIVTKSVDTFDGDEIPFLSNSLFNDRCEVKYMYAVTKLLSPSTAKFSCVLKLDVKFRVHQVIMNWFIKQLAGAVLPLLRRQAQYIADNPEDLLYSERFAANAEFYIHFLLPEFRAFIQSRNWPQPVIGCLGYAGIPVKGADYSLPVYYLEIDSQSSSPVLQRIPHQREPSNDSRSSVMSYYSCIQEQLDPGCTSFLEPPIERISRPLLEDEPLKQKSETTRNNSTCCDRAK